MAVNANIPATVVNDLYTGDHEILTVEVKPSSKILFILCNRPPSSSITEFVHDLDNNIEKSTKIYSKLCLLGDFNLPGIKWGDIPLSSKQE